VSVNIPIRPSGEELVRCAEYAAPAARVEARSVDEDLLARVRALCLALPAVTERLSHGAPSFFVQGKRAFVMYMNDHHGDGRLALWCKAPPGVQDAFVRMDRERFFVPPYVGVHGWLGARLDREPDWDLVGEIIRDAYRASAPSRLRARLG
jgi:hypothetical protein